MSEQPDNPICCRKHWEEARAFHVRVLCCTMMRNLKLSIVCATCGNAWCPCASDCSLECTGSSEQMGYPCRFLRELETT